MTSVLQLLLTSKPVTGPLPWVCGSRAALLLRSAPRGCTRVSGLALSSLALCARLGVLGQLLLCAQPGAAWLRPGLPLLMSLSPIMHRCHVPRSRTLRLRQRCWVRCASMPLLSHPQLQRLLGRLPFRLLRSAQPCLAPAPAPPQGLMACLASCGGYGTWCSPPVSPGAACLLPFWPASSRPWGRCSVCRVLSLGVPSPSCIRRATLPTLPTTAPSPC